MKQLLFLVSTSLFISCTSKNTETTATEENAINSLEETYDTQVAFTKASIEDNGETLAIFNAKMESNTLLDTLNMVFAGSHMGILVYEQLSQEEKATYGGFQVQFEKNGESYEQAFKYNKNLAVKAIEKAKLFDEFADNLLEGNYEEAAGLVKIENRNENDVKALNDYMEIHMVEHGKPTGYKRTGWGLNTTNTVFHFNGFLTFDNGYVLPFLVAMTDNTVDTTLIGYKFE
ncbi:hypothetical protein [Rasiella sp. SM2506]|uniref:hypothetical protein n=1 Tax=Rasiella sp. SM2506 TaxID=3423914 RepID=UPI003D7BA933